MKLLPQQLMRGVEMCAATLDEDATPAEIAMVLTSENVGCVPLARNERGPGYTAVPLPGRVYDPWALASRSARDIKRDTTRWAQADAVGITFPHGGPDWVLDPSTRKLKKYAIHITVGRR